MRPLWIASAALALSIGLGAVGTHAQQGASAAKRQGADAVDLSATAANVAAPGMPVKIRIIRWSTEEERVPLLMALTAPPPPPTREIPGAERGGTARGARGGAPPAARGGQAPAAGRAAQNGRAAQGGRGGRGELVPRAPATPVDVLTDAIGKAPTVGYVWTNDVTGYSIRYAWHAAANGVERIVLVTDRRLDMYSAGWKPAASAPETDYAFTLIEIRLGARGVGLAKSSLTTKVVVDGEAKTLALDNFDATPAILQNVTHYTPKITE